MDFAKQKTEGAREMYSNLELTGTKEKLHALSFSRLRRQLPPGGSLCHKNVLLWLFIYFSLIGISLF